MSKTPRPKPDALVWLLLSIVVIGLDQVSKRWVLSSLPEYTPAGKATGRQLPEDTFSFEAEGVALWSCRHGKGYWVSVDQLAPLTVFHVFDRKTLRRVGSIPGPPVATANTRTKRADLPAGLGSELVGRPADDARRTAELCPEIDLGLWPSLHG